MGTTHLPSGLPGSISRTSNTTARAWLEEDAPLSSLLRMMWDAVILRRRSRAASGVRVACAHDQECDKPACKQASLLLLQTRFDSDPEGWKQ